MLALMVSDHDRCISCIVNCVNVKLSFDFGIRDSGSLAQVDARFSDEKV